MAQVSKYKKPKIFLIAVGIALVVGILAFVLAYGLSKGWEEVAWWFGSKYAVLLYVGVGLYGLLLAYILIMDWYKKI